MRSNDLLIDEDYHVRRPPLQLGNPIDLGNPNTPWRATVIALRIERRDDRDRLRRDGVLVRCCETHREVVVPSRHVISTWSSHENRIAERREGDARWQEWEDARNREIADSHLTLCAHVQSLGREVPEELVTPRGDYHLSAADILTLLGASQATVIGATVRPMHQPREPRMPLSYGPKLQRQRMQVLRELAKAVQRLRQLNERDPADLTGLIGPDSEGGRMLGYVSEGCDRSRIAESCRRAYGLSTQRVYGILTALRTEGFVRILTTGGWAPTAAGWASLEEHQRQDQTRPI